MVRRMSHHFHDRGYCTSGTIYKVTGVDFEGKRVMSRFFRFLKDAQDAFGNIEVGAIWQDNPYAGWPEGTFLNPKRSDRLFWIRLEVKKP